MLCRLAGSDEGAFLEQLLTDGESAAVVKVGLNRRTVQWCDYELTGVWGLRIDEAASEFLEAAVPLHYPRGR